MTDKEYLDKALDLIVKLEGDNDYICEELCKIQKENDFCADNCENFDRFCVLRYLKYYE